MNLEEVVRLHELWLSGNGGACADLRGAKLARAKLAGRDLSRANLARADLEGADLRGAKLIGANLCAANLHCAKLGKADLTNAVLTRCSACFVSFKDVNLSGCDFLGADMSGADLSQAIFNDSFETQLALARLTILPKEGSFIGWKRLRGNRLCKLKITEKAKRSNGFGRRCRASYARVLEIIDDYNEPWLEGTSKRDADLKYKVGRIVKADAWDENWMNECSHGINFFLTREEAEAYG